MVATDVRIALSAIELINHDKQIENAKVIDEFLQNKYTNQELYTWIKGQISVLFFQSYQLAYDLAKRAERTYRFELGLTDSNFIKFGYWDNLRQGLLSGDKLYHDLKRLELSYLEQHKREYELTKPISLLQLNPLALIALKATGQCEVDLPEWLFDLDYPGHYMRRIKNVSITIPCVAGPYTRVSCTLTLLSSEIRIKNVSREPYSRSLEGDDDRFLLNFAAMQSIATSTAQNDSGLFELNFRDERYLPFEGAGVISRWRIEIPNPDKFPQFDYSTISDVVLQLRYTAREGGEGLKKMAVGAIQETWNPSSEGVDHLLTRLFSAKHEFSDQWHLFLHPQKTDVSHKLDLAITPNRFPFPFRGKTITISKIEVFLKFKDIKDPTTYTAGDNSLYPEAVGTPLGDYIADTALDLDLTPPGSGSEPVIKSLDVNPLLKGIPHAIFAEEIAHEVKASDSWSIEAKDDKVGAIAETLWTSIDEHNRLKAEATDDLLTVCHYSVQSQQGN